MIYVKSPLRISMGGGGTDLPWWYSKYNGYVISFAIDKYVHLIGSKRVFDKKIWLSYSKTEICEKIDEIKNEIFKETLRYKKIKNGIEIHTISDVPGNSGLGSSGAFTSALIYFLDLLKKNKIYKKDIASTACKIEMNYLKKNSGIQDQYISVFGGLKEIFVSKTGKVRVKSLKIKKKNIKKLEESLMLVYTNQTRQSEQILSSLKKEFKMNSEIKTQLMKKIHNIGLKSKKFLQEANIEKLGALFDEHWKIKKSLSPLMTNPKIDNIYKLAKKNGAEGGKLIGAGGGGYLLFFVKKKNRNNLLNFLKSKKFEKLDFKFDNIGTRQITDKK